MTPSQLIWRNSGSPATEHKSVLAAELASCGTCGGTSERWISSASIVTPTFGNHADFLRGNFVCQACAWLFCIGKARPGNVLAYDDIALFPVLSALGVSEGRPRMSDALKSFAMRPNSTDCVAIITTDTKPRVWPRARMASRRYFGCYIHAGEYDTSGFRHADLDGILSAVKVIASALTTPLKCSKALIRRGLFTDAEKLTKNGALVSRIEAALRPLRDTPEFLPALIVAGPEDT